MNKQPHAHVLHVYLLCYGYYIIESAVQGFYYRERTKHNRSARPGTDINVLFMFGREQNCAPRVRVMMIMTTAATTIRARAFFYRIWVRARPGDSISIAGSLHTNTLNNPSAYTAHSHGRTHIIYKYSYARVININLMRCVRACVRRARTASARPRMIYDHRSALLRSDHITFDCIFFCASLDRWAVYACVVLYEPNRTGPRPLLLFVIFVDCTP